MSSSLAWPTEQQVTSIVNEYLDETPDGAVVVGVAAPSLSPFSGEIFRVGGNLVTPQNQPVALTGSTPFWIASLTKTFTATLFAHYASQSQDVWTGTVGGYQPAGSAPLYSD